MGLPLTYHWRSLFVRKTTTLLTVLVVTAVVAVLAWMAGFAGALQGSLDVAGDPTKVIVLKRGATSESTSAIPVDDVGKLTQVGNVAEDPDSGEPLISPEVMVQVQLPRLRDGGKTIANVAVRGVTKKAFGVHRNVRLLGRSFSTGAPEVIVGAATAKQFAGLEVGQTIKLGYGGNRDFTIVGHFSADGGPLESEIWAYAPTLMNVSNREMYSSVCLRMQDEASARRAVEQIEGPAIQLTAMTEGDYWQEQSQFIRVYLGIAYGLVGIMCLAAVFSIANTMYSAVAGRTREVAMLRTIGYSKAQILVGFVIEAVLLSLLGGAAGCLACAAWLQLIGNTKDMFGANTFTTLAFEIQLTPAIITTALVVVALVGVCGALAPAARAARMEIITALRAE